MYTFQRLMVKLKSLPKKGIQTTSIGTATHNNNKLFNRYQNATHEQKTNKNFFACYTFKKNMQNCMKYSIPRANRKPFESTNALSISCSRSPSDKLRRCCASWNFVCFLMFVGFFRKIDDGFFKADVCWFLLGVFVGCASKRVKFMRHGY